MVLKCQQTGHGVYIICRFMYESKGMKDGHKVPKGEYQFRLEYRSNTCVDIDI